VDLPTPPLGLANTMVGITALPCEISSWLSYLVAISYWETAR